MNKRGTMKKTISVILSVFLISLFPIQSVGADVAPPEAPPGANLVPGMENTQVRMMAEKVLLTITEDPTDARGAVAYTEATFSMRNLGSTEERMQVRFPLTFFNGNSDGFGNFPEIDGINAKVSGRAVSTRREMQPYLAGEFSYPEQDEIPWAVFEVTFPPAQDVTIQVSYTVNGYGYYPYESFLYVLETGAGWNGTIGIADVIVRFPYEVNEMNIWLDFAGGYSEATQDATLSGNEVRWHYEELEPTREHNPVINAVAPALWKSILREIDAVTRNPKDGEAWGRLGKAYKEIARMPKGYLREDEAGRKLFQLSREAYETCLGLLPEDSLWHTGYADLLWSHYYFDIHGYRKADTDGILPLLLTHLQTALALDPNNQLARDLLDEIRYSVSDAVEFDGNEYIYLALTATPLPPTPFGGIATETPSAPLTPAAEETLPPIEIPGATPVVPPATVPSPLCGSFGMILPVLAGLWWVSSERRKQRR